MRRHAMRLLVLLVLGLLTISVAVKAQASRKIPRIGILNPFSPTVRNTIGNTLGHATVDAFRQGLEDLGYIEGETILMEYRWAEGHPERLADLAADLVRMRQVAFLNDTFADSQTSALHLREAQTAARKLDLQLLPVTVRDAEVLSEAFTTMTQQGAEALVIGLSAFTLHHRRQLVAFAAQSRIPAIYQSREFVEAGGLMSCGTDRLDQWRRAATYVDQILKGAKPADLPVQQPRNLELVLNLKATQALALEFPPTILLQANQVIE